MGRSKIPKLLQTRAKLAIQEQKLMKKINKQIGRMRENLDTPHLKSIVSVFLDLIEKLESVQQKLEEVEQEIIENAGECDCD